MNCPSCHKKLGWLQESRFGKGFCSRKAAECPHCNVTLIWAKWPHALMQFGLSSVLLGFWSELLFPVKILDGFDLCFWCSILGLPLLTLGIFRQKFCIIGESKE